MTDYDLSIPDNFSITDALADFVRREVIGGGWVPCITWSYSVDEDEEQGRPTIGGFEPAQVPEGSLRTVDGIDFVFVLNPKLKLRLDNHILDFADERGPFLRERK